MEVVTLWKEYWTRRPKTCIPIFGLIFVHSGILNKLINLSETNLLIYKMQFTISALRIAEWRRYSIRDGNVFCKQCSAVLIKMLC